MQNCGAASRTILETIAEGASEILIFAPLGFAWDLL